MCRRPGVRRAAGVTALSLTSTALAAAIALAAPAHHVRVHATATARMSSIQNQQGDSNGQGGTTTSGGTTTTSTGTMGTTQNQQGGNQNEQGATQTQQGATQSQPGATPDQSGTTGATPTFQAAPLVGNVSVVLPGSTQSTPLQTGMSLPSGTVVDARAGSVQLPSPGGGDPGVFKGGRFIVRQTGGANPRTALQLTGGSFAACPKAPSAAPAAVTASTASRRLGRHSVVRSLWGHDHHGHFSTSGRYAAAIVRGTTWLTQDRCDGTRVAVMQGAVAVHDAARHKTVIVRAGHSYLAKKP